RAGTVVITVCKLDTGLCADLRFLVWHWQVDIQGVGHRIPILAHRDCGRGADLTEPLAWRDDNGRILEQTKQETPKGDSAESVVAALVSAAQNWDHYKQAVVAASIMVPGAVDADKAVVLQAPNLPSLVNYPLKAELEKRLGWPVFLENDANAAAVGEMWLGAARGCSDVVSVTLGTGVGGGVILDGKLWRGSHGSAGEI